jgi:hypothetical protein
MVVLVWLDHNNIAPGNSVVEKLMLERSGSASRSIQPRHALNFRRPPSWESMEQKLGLAAFLKLKTK